MTVRVHRVATSGDVGLDVTEAGPADGPVVVLLHGFPESAHSWRHQIEPLAAAGYRVIVPDQRGYAGSSAPDAIEAYSAAHLTADVCALLDDAGAERAVIVGHDWGALVAWHMGLLHPERCRAVFSASVPFNTWPARPTAVYQRMHGDRFFYINYFQQPGVAEAEIEPQTERFLRAIYWALAGEAGPYRPSGAPLAGTLLVDEFEHFLGGIPEGLPPWLTPGDLATYVAQFERSGFRGPINWYRNFDANWELTKHLGPEALSMPTAFVAGQRDAVIAARDLVGAQDAMLPNHLGSTLLAGAGHWTQQERPAEFNAWLLARLAQI